MVIGVPGFFPHFIMGHVLFFFSFTTVNLVFKREQLKQNILLLYGVCIVCSIIPDFPLGLYYLFHIGSYESLLPVHALFHTIITPGAFILFLLFSLFLEKEKRPIWLIGFGCILIHIVMDLTIQELGVWW